MVYPHVKFETDIVNGYSVMDLNANYQFDLELLTFKVKVTDKGGNG